MLFEAFYLSQGAVFIKERIIANVVESSDSDGSCMKCGACRLYKIVSNFNLKLFCSDPIHFAVGLTPTQIDLIFKTIPQNVKMYITYLFNACITSSRFPNIWKIVRVVPVPKKIDANNVNDFLPIYILPALSYVLDKILKSQVTQYIH